MEVTDCPLQKVNARIIIVWLPRNPVVVTLHFWCMVRKQLNICDILTLYVYMYDHGQVVKSQLTGPEFVWLLPGWYIPGWWSDVNDTDCTVAEMKDGLEHSLTYASNSVVDTNLSRVIVSGKVTHYLIGMFIFLLSCSLY